MFMLNKTKQVTSIYCSQYSIACSPTAFTSDPGFDYFLEGGYKENFLKTIRIFQDLVAWGIAANLTTKTTLKMRGERKHVHVYTSEDLVRVWEQFS